MLEPHKGGKMGWTKWTRRHGDQGATFAGNPAGAAGGRMHGLPSAI